MKKERFVQAKVDVAFKYIFGEEKSIDNLKYFLSVVLKIPEDELVDITLSPTEQHRDSTSDKESIFDVSATLKNGKKIEIEIELRNRDNFINRSLYYISTMFYKSQMKGKGYHELKQCVVINILDYNVFNDEDSKNKAHSKYQILEADSNKLLTDLFEMHYLELKKLENDKKLQQADRELYLLLQFLRAESKEEIDMLVNKSVSLDRLIATKQEFENNDDHWAVYLRRLKQEAEREINEIDIRHAGIEEGRKEGIAIGEKRGEARGEKKANQKTALNLLQQGVDIAIISSATGLSEDEILQLK